MPTSYDIVGDDDGLGDFALDDIGASDVFGGRDDAEYLKELKRLKLDGQHERALRNTAMRSLAMRNAGAVVQRGLDRRQLTCTTCGNGARMLPCSACNPSGITPRGSASGDPTHRADDWTSGLVPVVFDTQLVRAGEHYTFKQMSQLPVRGPYRLSVRDVTGSEGELLVEDLKLGNMSLFMSPGQVASGGFVMDREEILIARHLVPVEGPACLAGTEFRVIVHNPSCATREVCVTVWGYGSRDQIRENARYSVAATEQPLELALAAACREISGKTLEDHGHLLAVTNQGPNDLTIRHDKLAALGEKTILGRMTGEPSAPSCLPLSKIKAFALRWFGPPWNAEVCNPETNDTASTPRCEYCRCSFMDGDQGFVLGETGTVGLVERRSYHRHCLASYLGIDEPWHSPVSAPKREIGDPRYLAHINDQAATNAHLERLATPPDAPEDACWESPTDEWP